MEAKAVADKRKRLSSPIIDPKGFDGSSLGPTLRRKPDDAKIRRLESFGSRYLGWNDALPRDLVKDLRSHRVFSPSSELYREICNQKLGFEFGFDDSEDDVKAAKIEDISCEGQRICEKTGKIDLGFPSLERIDVLDKQCAPKRPNPEAKVPADPGIRESQGNRMGAGKPSNGIAQTNGCVIGDTNNDSDSKTKPFLRPCFRRKVFKTPGSISYRRLLPYLMDISKNDSGEGENDGHPILDMLSEEKKPQNMEDSQNEVAAKDGVDKNRISVECPKFDEVCREMKLQASQSEEASKDGVGKNIISVECQSSHYDTIVQSCAIESPKREELNLASSDDVFLLLSTVGTDESSAMTLVNEIQNSKVGFSCADQKSTNLDCQGPVVVKVLQDTADDVHTPSDDSKLKEYGSTMENDSQFPCNDQDGDIGVTDEMRNHNVESQKPNQMNNQIGGDNDELLNQADNLIKGYNQMTPPDAEISGKPEVERNEVEIASGINNGNASLDYNTKHESNSKCRAVLKPRSQMKLFRSPGSFSYKRMLPFLMNIAKDNSDTSAKGLCAPQKDLEHPSLLASDNQKIPSDKSIGLGFEETRKDCPAALQLAEQPSVKDSSKDRENLISPEQDTEFQTSSISQKEESLQAKVAVFSSPSELETSPSPDCSSLVMAVQDTSRQVVLSCFSNRESSSREQLTISNFNQSSVETEGDLSGSAIKSSDVVKPVEEYKLCHVSPQTALIPVSSVTPVSGSRKGILKRNPRGCRGLCTCLNCTSFRLHAERGFEFSRNQMGDAEEVVLDLIKELSHLRNVLGKSVDDADNHIVNANQVKEVCRKASEAEELAKDRLNQMNYDLSIHCRITCLEPPRVRFADRVEENVIPKASSPSKQVLKHEKENGQRELNTK